MTWSVLTVETGLRMRRSRNPRQYSYVSLHPVQEYPVIALLLSIVAWTNCGVVLIRSLREGRHSTKKMFWWGLSLRLKLDASILFQLRRSNALIAQSRRSGTWWPGLFPGGHRKRRSRHFDRLDKDPFSRLYTITQPGLLLSDWPLWYGVGD